MDELDLKTLIWLALDTVSRWEKDLCQMTHKPSHNNATPESLHPCGDHTLESCRHRFFLPPPL